MAGERAKLERADRLWQCTRCGYFAYSSPDYTIHDEEGRDVGGGQHVCPTCGEQCWHWCGGDSREKRAEYVRAARLSGGDSDDA